MGLGNVFATMMMFAILVTVFFTMVNINKNAMLNNSELLKMKQKSTMEKEEQAISIVPGINFTVFQQYSINVTNTGKSIIPISELSLYLDNRKISIEDISSVMLVREVVNPGLWDPFETIMINFTAARDSGTHTIRVSTGQGVTDSMTLSFSTCRNAQPYYPNDVTLNYSTIVESDGTWSTTMQLNQLTSMDNWITSGNGFNDNHGGCIYEYTGSTTVANPFHRTLVWVNMTLLPGNIDVHNGMFSWYVYSLQSAGVSNNRTNISRMTEDWTEGTGSCTDNNQDGSGSTWAAYDGMNAWTTAGGTYDPTPINDSTVEALNRWMYFDISPLAIGWYNGIYPNYGFITRTVDEGTAIQTRVLARSSEYATGANRPRLNVTYNPYCFDITVVN